MVPRTAEDLRREASGLNQVLTAKLTDRAWSRSQIDALRDRVIEVEAQALLLRLNPNGEKTP